MIQPTSIWRCKVCISHRHVSYDFHDVTILLPTGWTKELHSVIRPQGLSYLLYAWLNLHGLSLANQYPSNWHKILRAFFQNVLFERIILGLQLYTRELLLTTCPRSSSVHRIEGAPIALPIFLSTRVISYSFVLEREAAEVSCRRILSTSWLKQG